MAEPRRVIILGAAGRDFHNFNVVFRDNPAYRIVAFTATQIPGIEGRKYPASLAGPLYPDGIPIFPEDDLPSLIRTHGAQTCVFSYSDVEYGYIGHRIALANAHGADFLLLGAQETMLPVSVPSIAICAVRTGSGKSQTTRRIAGILRAHGKKVVVVRHPMPYGDLAAQAVERFATYEDLDRYETTIEEREEYEPHIDKGTVVYAGVDYERIFRQAEQEAEVLLWDGGNNDTPFVKPDLHITLVDPLRPGHELLYFPGRWNLERADVVVVPKIDDARPGDIVTVLANIARVNPRAAVCRGRSPVSLSDAEGVRGRRALVIEDGPTATHGGMGYGAGLVAARRGGAAAMVDPRPYATGLIADAFRAYPHLRDVLPALGYGERELRDLEETIDRADCDVVVVGTPIDLSRVIRIKKPVVRVTYAFEEASQPGLAQILAERFAAG